MHTLQCQEGMELAAEKLLAHCEVAANDCWNWTAARSDKGYGRLWFQGGARRAHVLAFKTWRGPVPCGLSVLHECDKPACINPSHLRVGTNVDNINDKVAKNRTSHGEAHAQAKLTAADVLALRDSAENVAQAARRLGVTRKTVRDARNGVTWAHVGSRLVEA